ncbi:2-C-methyl-D-erythritol 2,4-cyclodiphosphate synthase [Alphaproteobacteria bacterium]|nr:2-C-methyl-D-erythritol 2,4-cyclodiphosphate synthase [Alphaproteobacteria bacterium]
MDFAYIILAAGSSERFKSKFNKIEKQFYLINQKTILEICIENFIKLNIVDKLFLVVSKTRYDDAIKICNKYNLPSPIIGGNTRQESVFKALKKLNNLKPKNVIIHDAARPYINKNVIKNLISNIKNDFSCVVPTLNIADAVIKNKPNKNVKYLNKKNYLLLQTPQICDFDKLLTAHKKVYNKYKYDDDSSLLMDNGFKIKYIEGDPKSLKITYMEDLNLIKSILENQLMKNYITKTGIGYDVHKLLKNNSKNKYKKLILGGLKIENGYFLKGHSDADVLLHAITDSIYGALNENDIGYHFPPTENKWKNCDSFVFLKHALSKLKEKNAELIHIDSVIITESPKILDYVDEIKNKISNSTGISKEILSIKGKSNEGIGFIGRKEGIAVLSNTTIKITYD